MHEFSPQLTGERAQNHYQELFDEAEQERQLQAIKTSLRQRLVNRLYALASKLEPATPRAQPT